MFLEPVLQGAAADAEQARSLGLHAARALHRLLDDQAFERYIVPARARRFRIVGYRFEAPFDELLRRNATRRGRACVPEVAIRATLARLEPPDWSEGFDVLFHVRPAADDPRGVTITPVSPETTDAIRGT